MSALLQDVMGIPWKVVGIAILLTALIVAPCTAVICYFAWRDVAPATTETFAPGYRQNDERGSRVADRVPTAQANLPPAPHAIPKGAPEVRRLTVTVEPRPVHPVEPVLPDANGLCPVSSCPAVTVDLSLVREREGVYRAIASSPDGEVLRAIDFPILEFGRHQPANAVHAFANVREDIYAATYVRTMTVFGQKIEAGAMLLHAPVIEFAVLGGVGVRFD